MAQEADSTSEVISTRWERPEWHGALAQVEVSHQINAAICMCALCGEASESHLFLIVVRGGECGRPRRAIHEALKYHHVLSLL